jgi:hypothetical protein
MGMAASGTCGETSNSGGCACLELRAVMERLLYRHGIQSFLLSLL